MNKTQLAELIAAGKRPSLVFRAMLEGSDSPSRMALFHQLKEAFNIPVEKLSFLGGWEYWNGNGYTDEDVDREFEGLLIIRLDQ
jgi:hypothetical protein